ncbi:hypothetical protein HK105_201905 [Polyrhizophydium stewartii]|uniref:HAUS augmin-like complex subunit 6 N-terminal domain-containing protein n=1 Tax=Polyrhizophydium stewartii TaxID=2732419 RepID=A0ABR4NG37_9FUNG
MDKAILTALGLQRCPALQELPDPAAALFGSSPSTKLWERILHFLVVKLDPELSQRFQDCFPTTTPAHSRDFRLALHKSLESLRKAPGASFPLLQQLTMRKSDLDSVRGDRFERIVLALASEALSCQTAAMHGAPPVFEPPASLPPDMQLKLLRAHTLLRLDELLESIASMGEARASWTRLGSELGEQSEQLEATLATRADLTDRNQASLGAEMSSNASSGLDAEIQSLSRTQEKLSSEMMSTTSALTSWLTEEYRPITPAEAESIRQESISHDSLLLRPSQEASWQIQKLSQEASSLP